MSDPDRDGPAFPHVEDGGPRMVDISAKPEVAREATATGRIALEPETVAAVEAGETRKGDAFAVARVAAVQAVKRTWDEVPLCHQLPVSGIEVDLETGTDPPGVRATVTVRTTARTGPEMEALNGTSRALLTVWDVVKDAEKGPEGGYPGTAIEDLHVVEKTKGEAESDEAAGGTAPDGGESDGDDR